MVLSPTYAEYKKALDNVNDRMCRELGLYVWNSNYNLVTKKDNSKSKLNCPLGEEKSFSQRAFSIYTDIRKLQDKAKTSYTLSTRRLRFGYE